MFKHVLRFLDEFEEEKLLLAEVEKTLDGVVEVAPGVLDVLPLGVWTFWLTCSILEIPVFVSSRKSHCAYSKKNNYLIVVYFLYFISILQKWIVKNETFFLKLKFICLSKKTICDKIFL